MCISGSLLSRYAHEMFGAKPCYRAGCSYWGAGTAAATSLCSSCGCAALSVQIALPRNDLYLPTSPELRVRAVLPESATPMQSAAKVPILVAFQVRARSIPSL